MATTTTTAKGKSHAVFGPMQCHHRDEAGKPDCRAKRAKAHQNLCPKHEAIWQKAARERAKARRAEMAKPKVSEAPSGLAAFATPELAAKARAKRSAPQK